MRKFILIIFCLASLMSFGQQYRIEHYSVEDGLSQNNVMAILQDHDGFIWFGTWDGLNRFDGNQFVVYKSHPSDNNVMRNNRVDKLYEDSIGNICFKTNDDLCYKVNKQTNEIEVLTDSLICEYLLRNSQVDSIYIDKHGIIWRVTDEMGISRCKDGQWKHFTPKIDMRFAGLLRKNAIFIEDKQGKLWVNPTGGGFSRYNYETDELENPIGGITNMVHTAIMDRQGDLWISTYDNGIDHIDIGEQTFGLHDLRSTSHGTGEARALIEIDGKVKAFTRDNMIYSVLKTEDGLLYGYKGKGIVGKDIDIDIDSKDIYDLEMDNQNHLYIATYGKGVYIVDNLKNPIQIRQVGDGKKVRDILVTDSLVLAATTQGLLNVNTEEFIPFFDIRSLFQDSKGRIWVGSFGGGFSKLVQKDGQLALEPISTNKDIVLSIQEDRSGNIWFSSETSLTRFSPGDGTTQTFEALWNMSNAYFTEAEAIRLTSGDLVFGYSNGYCQFTPESIIPSTDIPPIQFTNLYVFNQERHIPQDCIELNHKESSFSISYAAIDYKGNNSQIQYAYKLDGFDDDWNYVKDQRRAIYTNIPNGLYKFRVRSTNPDGVWVDNEKSIDVLISPSFWQTGWALLLYLGFGMLVVLVMHNILNTYNGLKQEVAVEQKVTDIKLRFFTNVSHELRTPLTLITGPVESILRNEDISDNVRSQLEIVESNSNRMLRMINQILDFRKVQSQKMRLNVQLTDFKTLIHETCGNFNKEAFDRHINFKIENNAPDALIWIDREKVDTILFNLLSNAFKFTPSGKSVTVRIDETDNDVLLKISDTGVGIPKEKQGILFERFRSHDEINNPSSQPGTGIGLSLAKELIDLHKGTIEVESEVNVGTTFTVTFHKGKDHFGKDVDIIISDGTPISSDMQKEVTNQELIDSKDKNILLIVEDNDDMRKFLQTMFEKAFCVITAIDGLDGLSKARTQVPSLIISDLMMPNMDGDEMVRALKQDANTCHIPIILLTAKSAIENKLTALEDGADDYITKPFSPEYLQARVGNILKQRSRLQESYRQHLLDLNTQPKENEDQKKSPNEIFLSKLIDFMERNMDNSSLTVDDMVSEMALGRTVFFNKLKSLTGLSPVEFIREIRIKRAAQLLQEGQYNITEITYMVGMNDSRYFSKCFKAVYGKTPTEYKRELKE